MIVYVICIGVHCIVATPGRLNDLLKEGHINFDVCKYLTLDEGDRVSYLDSILFIYYMNEYVSIYYKSITTHFLILIYIYIYTHAICRCWIWDLMKKFKV